MRLERFGAWDRLCAGAAIVTFGAAFLPWASVPGERAAGTDGDGQLTVLCAVAGLAVLALQRASGPVQFGRRLTLATLSATAALVLLVGIANLSSSAAIGVYLTVLAGLVWIVGVVLGWRTPAPVPLDEWN
jgi:hypothetical protein